MSAKTRNKKHFNELSRFAVHLDSIISHCLYVGSDKQQLALRITHVASDWRVAEVNDVDWPISKEISQLPRRFMAGTLWA